MATEGITEADFTARFVAYMVKAAGFTHFDDGTAVEAYACEVVKTYWDEPLYREDGPEASAESDMDYWGEA